MLGVVLLVLSVLLYIAALIGATGHFTATAILAAAGLCLCACVALGARP